jgi:hypothetical protein
VSAAPVTGVILGDQFARELPEMAVRWRAETAPDRRLLVLNEPLAIELGLDADWLRTSDAWLALDAYRAHNVQRAARDAFENLNAEK